MFCYFLWQQNLYAVGMVDGVWKGMNKKSQSLSKDSISGFVLSEIHYNNTYNSTNRKNKYEDTSLHIKAGVDLKLSNNFSVKTVVQLEEMSQATEDARRDQLASGGGDRFLENEGGYVDELILNYNYKNLSALVGKFTVNFGSAWKDDKGIWVNETAKKYKESEKLGLGLISRFGDKEDVGEYVFGFSSFTNDRKNLDNSVVTKRDGFSKSDGDVGDSRNLKSYAMSMDIYYQFVEKEKLSYHFSYANLAINDRQNSSNIPANINDQKSFVFNVNYQYPINNNILIDGLVEYASINNLGGNVGAQEDFLTINLTGYINNFYLTIARVKDQKSETGTKGVDSHINELSVGYQFGGLNSVLDGLSLVVGYNEREVDNKIVPVNDNAFGMILEYVISY